MGVPGKVGHLSVMLPRKPFFKLPRRGGWLGAGDTAVIKAKFARPLLDGRFHRSLIPGPGEMELVEDLLSDLFERTHLGVK